MAIIICPECGKDVSDKADKCIHCGFPIYMKVNMSIEQKKCLFCGSINDGYLNNCKTCGASLNETIVKKEIENSIESNIEINPYKKTKNKTTALLLCIFLGFFGVHKFYEGKIGMGVLYLFTGGLFYIGWIYDIIDIIRKPNPYYVCANGSNNYLKNTDVDVESIVLNNKTNKVNAIKEYREQTGASLKEAMDRMDSAYSDMGVNPLKKYCPRCKSGNCSVYVKDISKSTTSINLNPLKPFTVYNHKEKTVKEVSKFVCNDCGKIFV